MIHFKDFNSTKTLNEWIASYDPAIINIETVNYVGYRIYRVWYKERYAK